MLPEIIIRTATEADLPAIHALVRELAEYEREPEAVVTTPEIYLEDFRNGRFESQGWSVCWSAGRWGVFIDERR